MKQYKKPSVFADSETPHIVPLAAGVAALASTSSPAMFFAAGAAAGLGMSKKGNAFIQDKMTPLRKVEIYT